MARVQNQSRFKNRISFTRFADILATPPANCEHAQVTATLQPDGAQVFIELIERSQTYHLQVEPKILIVSILNA